MSWIKYTTTIFIISFVFFIIGDNFIYEKFNRDLSQRLKIDFRHSAYEDYRSSPSSYYISISNESLDKSFQRFRTGKYGEILYKEYDSTVYEKKCKYVFIGGSSTETRWVDEKDRWVAQIDNNIRNKNINLAAFNFGVGGQNLAQSLIRYSSYIIDLKPKIVFVMHEANDISKFFKGGYSVSEGSLHNLYDREDNRKPMLKRFRKIIDKLLPFSSQNWRKYRNKNFVPLRQRSISQQYIGLEANISAQQYLGRLLALKQLINSHEGKLVLIEYPEIYKEVLTDRTGKYNQNVKSNLVSGLDQNFITKNNFLNYLKIFRNTVHNAAKNNHIEVIKTNGVLNASHFYDAIHFNKTGSRKFSKFMINQLSKFNCM